MQPEGVRPWLRGDGLDDFIQHKPDCSEINQAGQGYSELSVTLVL